MFSKTVPFSEVPVVSLDSHSVLDKPRGISKSNVYRPGTLCCCSHPPHADSLRLTLSLSTSYKRENWARFLGQYTELNRPPTPPNSCPPRTCDCDHDFIWKQGRCTGTKMRSHTAVRCALSPTRCYPYKRELGHRDTGKKPCEDGGRDWSGAAMGQGTPSTGSNTSSCKGKDGSTLEPSEGTWPANTLTSDFYKRNRERKKVSTVLSPQVVVIITAPQETLQRG